METLIEQVRGGRVPEAVTLLATTEGIDEVLLCNRISGGSVVIMQRGERLVGIGKGLSTKVNCNIGTSTSRSRVEDEVEKARIAERYGADTLSDLSMGGDINAIRSAIMGATTLPVTTVPVYQAVAENGLSQMDGADILATMQQQARDGVSSFVVHCVNHAMLHEFRRKKRVLGVVSKGGSITSAFMLMNQCDNPFTEHFDEILSICRQYDIVLSLGNTARSGCISDHRDRAQLEEIRQNIALADRACEQGVQVIIEGAGGHVRSDRIASQVRYYKKRAPYPLFVAGPLPVDTAVGFDHIAGCAGAGIASAAGADYLCYLTPAEHLGLPGPESVKEGLIAFRIAAHIGDTAKYHRVDEDRRIALMRAALDREGPIQCSPDPERARKLADTGEGCTMCGDFCAIRIMKEWLS